MLRELGRPFRAIGHHADETVPAGIAPERAAVSLAVRKAKSVSDALDAVTLIAADTLVAVGDDIIGKPADAADAARILQRLSATPHCVVTGLCVVNLTERRRLTGFARTRVVMRPMSASEIAAYVAGGESMGKAGAYAIQETGDRFVERIEGSLSNVVGLPMRLLQRMIALAEEGQAAS